MSRFDWSLANTSYSQQPTARLVHHPWRTGTDAGGTQRKIDSFLVRTKRRTDRSWGSDGSSTIFTESSTSGSQASLSSQCSHVVLSNQVVLRKLEEEGGGGGEASPSSSSSSSSAAFPPSPPPNRKTGAVQLQQQQQQQQQQHLPPTTTPTNPVLNRDNLNPDPRDTIINAQSSQQGTIGAENTSQHKRSSSSDSNNSNSNNAVRSSVPGAAVPRFERGIYRCDTDFVAPLPPRNPSSSSSPKPPTRAARQAKRQEHHYRTRVSEPPRTGTKEAAAAAGPIDVDTLEAYREHDFETSLVAPPAAVAVSEKRSDEDDDEQDYREIRAFMKRFPILDERYDERVLCGYYPGFEPEQDDDDKDFGKGEFEI